MKIGDLGRIVTGSTPSTKRAEYWNGGVPFVTPGDLRVGKYITATARTLSQVGMSAVPRSVLPAGAVCVSCIGTIGLVGMTAAECMANQQINAVVTSEEYDPDYVYYLMRRMKRRFAQYEGQSTALSIINKADLCAMELPGLPPLSEQKRISGILSLIDEKIELSRRICENIRQQGSILMRRHLASCTSTVRLGEVMKILCGHTFPSSSFSDSGRYRVITIKHVRSGFADTNNCPHIDEIPPKMKEYCHISEGDILLTLTGIVGRTGLCAENGLLLNQRTGKAEPVCEELRPLVYFYLDLPETAAKLSQLSKGTAQANLSPADMMDMPISFHEKQSLLISEKLRPLFDMLIVHRLEALHLERLLEGGIYRLMPDTDTL